MTDLIKLSGQIIKKNKKTKETQIEQFLRKAVKEKGGLSYKFTSPGNRAVPDRICMFPGGVIAFVECKRPGKKPTPMQAKELDKMRKLGFIATFVSTKSEVTELVHTLKNLSQEYLKAINEVYNEK